MGRLVVLLILSAGLPGILLGTGLAFLAFDPVSVVPALSTWNLPDVRPAAALLIVLSLVLAYGGAAARHRPAADPQ